VMAGFHDRGVMKLQQPFKYLGKEGREDESG
jgi:hypothetical protein